ncbi:MAG TPA: beta-hexosaminidase, partial [Candidatus Jeotgalibaca merdavium]|nr:beta-hexosaminidase [Candidatus Jeotgalibaca merdavium]
SQYVETAVRISQEEKVGSVLKHFPGYGDNVDTHTGVAYDNRALENFYDRDFLPFQAGIAQDVAAILVSHNVVTAIDDRLPASLSPAVIDLLRNDLAFNGIIMTDDLVMEGVQQFLEPEEAAVQAVLAGNDVVISSDVTIQREAVLAAVAEGRLSEERINESVLRILKIKLQLELID